MPSAAVLPPNKGCDGGIPPYGYAEPLNRGEEMDKNKAIGIAHDLLMSEFDDLQNDPHDYLQAVGADTADYASLQWNDADWQESDTQRLAEILMKSFNESLKDQQEPLMALADAIYSDEVSDCIHEIVMASINRLKTEHQIFVR